MKQLASIGPEYGDVMFYETSVEFQRTIRHNILEDRNLETFLILELDVNIQFHAPSCFTPHGYFSDSNMIRGSVAKILPVHCGMKVLRTELQ
jgi:hypothetical protein